MITFKLFNNEPKGSGFSFYIKSFTSIQFPFTVWIYNSKFIENWDTWHKNILWHSVEKEIENHKEEILYIVYKEFIEPIWKNT